MTSHTSIRRILLAALLASLALFAIAAQVASAAPTVPPSTFEGGDGNVLVNTGGNTDWESPAPNLTQKTDDDTGAFSAFVTGSKEQDPGNWDLGPASAPSKADILHAAYANDVVGSGDLFFYGAFERLDGAGNANVSFELNRIGPPNNLYDNGTDNVPVRSDGDLLITFDGNASNGVTVGMCIWHGDREGESSDSSFGWYTLPDTVAPIDPAADKKLKGSDNCTTLDGSTAVGAMNLNDLTTSGLSQFSSSIVSNRFGELSVNVSQALENAGIVSPCLAFGSAWVHSRSSDAPLSSMQDYVDPSGIGAATPCQIQLKKEVAVGSGTYQDANTPGSAVLASTGDQLNYRVTVTNPGANPITLDTDPPTDPECPLTVVSKLKSDLTTVDADGLLNPGDVWTYSCTKTYDASLADSYENVASVVGHEGSTTGCTDTSALPCVHASDPAWVQRAGRIEIVKDRLPDTSPDSFQFSTSTDLTARGLGAFSLSDDGVAGHNSTAINLWPNQGASGNGESYTVTEGALAAGYRLVDLTCTDSDTSQGATDSTVDPTDPKTAILNVEPGETVHCTYSNRFTAPGVAIDKTGPANATAGDLIPYTLTVTNPGQESLAASTVVVSDQQCTTAPVLQAKNTGGGTDQSPDSLDPGDSWIYTCSGQTALGQSSFTNTACVQGADVFGRSVSACDSVNTLLAQPPQQVVLGERVEPGEAHIAGATGCVARKFNVTVRGKQILRVEFRVDGRKRATVSKPDSKGRFVFKVDPRKFKPGSHLLVAKSTFTAASNTRAKTLKLRFARCVRRTAPAFTG